ncbi:MAG: cysteine--tRNA ligase, partial [Defluviitaleaceae bacterium]|nr:cysteine--tRNA ligase [Defluviitaleaceae bacterium]
KEEFVPIDPNEAKIYVCGETVYNYMHLGHARVHVVFDAIQRFMIYKGYKVTLVRNFTDIDDKIIAKAIEEQSDAKTVAEKYIEASLEESAALGTIPAAFYPRVTSEIDNIIEMIKILIDKGHAYYKNGHVFFETKTFKEYGKLSRKNPDELEAGARIEINDEKRSPMDFVLWKPNKHREPYWDSPWGTGRPGWHIECSAMVKKYLGETIDIHGGGDDIIFPHHENEIAQSEAANGKPLARYWIHNGPITSGHKKMSKSLNNFTLLRDAAKLYPYQTIRFLLLNAHYRMPLEYSGLLLESADNGFKRIKNCYDSLTYILQYIKTDKLSGIEKQWLAEADEYKEAFEKNMEDDFNTADAISSIFDLVKFINTRIDVNKPEEISRQFVKTCLDELLLLTSLLGLTFNDQSVAFDDKELIENMIKSRQAARAEKNWNEADKIRNELLKMNIIIEDTAGGIKWKKI